MHEDILEYDKIGVVVGVVVVYDGEEDIVELSDLVHV